MQNVHIPPFFYVAEQTILPLPSSEQDKKGKNCLRKTEPIKGKFIWQLLNTIRKDWAYLSDDSHVSVVRQPGHKPFAFGQIRFRP